MPLTLPPNTYCSKRGILEDKVAAYEMMLLQIPKDCPSRYSMESYIKIINKIIQMSKSNEKLMGDIKKLHTKNQVIMGDNQSLIEQNDDLAAEVSELESKNMFLMEQNRKLSNQLRRGTKTRKGSKGSFLCPDCGFVAATKSGLGVHRSVHKRRRISYEDEIDIDDITIYSASKKFKNI